ncbi:MAG: helix-hairpin-helix domain-containing protein [Cellulosilyticum sp.]|nr:helix-hairpin-helix domain-containing protein [Cellulosilyticum sp.]MEE1070800.1 helix-hairpin-helix domain-containing protein [Cellulosilyticum sp.]
MKEKVMQYKWIIMIICIIVLNIGWSLYSKQQSNNQFCIEEQTADSKEITQSKETTNSQEVTQSQEVVKVDGCNNNEKQLEENVDIVQSETPKEATKEDITLVQAQEPKEVPIYICGEVLNPGVYYVSTNAIINDVIICSGGMTRQADATAINLASPIVPNEKIIIPKQGEEFDKSLDSYENRERIETLPSSQLTSQPSKSASADSQNKLININTATKEELMTLNGVGEVKAEAIIVYRQENGAFESIDEMMQISGIGKKTFDKIKQFITTE